MLFIICVWTHIHILTLTWLVPCHSRWNIVHRPLVSIQLCLVLPPPSSSSCTCILLSTFLSADLFSKYSLVALFLCDILYCKLMVQNEDNCFQANVWIICYATEDDYYHFFWNCLMQKNILETVSAGVSTCRLELWRSPRSAVFDTIHWEGWHWPWYGTYDNSV